MTEAAFKACYAEWKVIKTRATVQLVFEIPIEQADAAYQALGGMPIAAKEVWCGIARLEQPVSRPVSQAEKQPGSEIGPQPSPVRADKPKRSIAQRAGMLCNDTLFHAFLRERFTNEWHDSLAQSGGPNCRCVASRRRKSCGNLQCRIAPGHQRSEHRMARATISPTSCG
jgi:hypothetical protein